MFVKDYMVQAQEEQWHVYNDDFWKSTSTQTFPRGQIVYYSNNTQVCNR